MKKMAILSLITICIGYTKAIHIELLKHHSEGKDIPALLTSIKTAQQHLTELNQVFILLNNLKADDKEKLANILENDEKLEMAQKKQASIGPDNYKVWARNNNMPSISFMINTQQNLPTLLTPQGKIAYDKIKAMANKETGFVGGLSPRIQLLYEVIINRLRGINDHPNKQEINAMFSGKSTSGGLTAVPAPATRIGTTTPRASEQEDIEAQKELEAASNLSPMPSTPLNFPPAKK